MKWVICMRISKYGAGAVDSQLYLSNFLNFIPKKKKRQQLLTMLNSNQHASQTKTPINLFKSLLMCVQLVFNLFHIIISNVQLNSLTIPLCWLNRKKFIQFDSCEALWKLLIWIQNLFSIRKSTSISSKYIEQWHSCQRFRLKVKLSHKTRNRLHNRIFKTQRAMWKIFGFPMLSADLVRWFSLYIRFWIYTLRIAAAPPAPCPRSSLMFNKVLF